MAKVLLSDIDGTLVDSNCLHAEAWRRAFEHFGIQVGMDEIWRQIGKGAISSFPYFSEKLIESDWREFIGLWVEYCGWMGND